MTLRAPPLAERHAERGAKVTDFGGWEMPVTFDSIHVEHEAVREDVGVFDVSHMGEIAISGSDAVELSQRLTTNDVTSLDIGDAHYTSMTGEDGLLLDDALIYRLDETSFLLVPNAGKDELITKRLRTYREAWDLTATVQNQTDEYGMLAIQGPAAEKALSDAGASVASIERLTIEELSIAGVECLCARTGYTGEDGFEVLIPWQKTETVDTAIPGQRCGLGARDTLRLEMGFVLAGNEFDQEENRRTPYEAGIGFAVSLDAEPAFVGHEALANVAAEGVTERLVGLQLTERGIPRRGYSVLNDAGDVVGEITSGTMSPTLGEAIALGYLDATYADDHSTAFVEIRGEAKKARIVTPPFLGSQR